MAKRKKSRRPRHGLQKFLVAIIAIVIVIVIGRLFIYDALKDKAAGVMAERLIQSEITSDTELTEQIQAQEILDRMTEEERDTVNQIMKDNMSPETAKQVSSYIANKDTTGLKSYAKATLSDAELAQIREIYAKYKDEILQEKNPESLESDLKSNLSDTTTQE